MSGSAGRRSPEEVSSRGGRERSGEMRDELRPVVVEISEGGLVVIERGEGGGDLR